MPHSLFDSMVEYLRSFGHGNEPFGLRLDKFENQRAFGGKEEDGKYTFYMDRHASLDVSRDSKCGMFSMLTYRKKYEYVLEPIEKIEEIDSVLIEYTFDFESEMTDLISNESITITQHADRFSFSDIGAGELGSADTKEELFECYKAMWKDQINFQYEQFISRLEELCVRNPDNIELKNDVERYKHENTVEKIFKRALIVIDRNFKNADFEDAREDEEFFCSFNSLKNKPLGPTCLMKIEGRTDRVYSGQRKSVR